MAVAELTAFVVGDHTKLGAKTLDQATPLLVGDGGRIDDHPHELDPGGGLVGVLATRPPGRAESHRQLAVGDHESRAHGDGHGSSVAQDSPDADRYRTAMASDVADMQNIRAVQTPLRERDADSYGSAVVTPVAGSMGAYVDGLDIAPGSDLDPLLRLLDDFKAVMIRDADSALTVEEYAAFGRRLGDLAVDPFVAPPFPAHPEVMGLIREADDTAYNFGGDWHSDGSYLAEPGGYTVLWAKEIPPVGGDTLFADMELAWESLSPTFREMLDGRRCAHAATGSGAKVAIARKGDYAAINFGDAPDRIEHLHPIKRIHPRTGRPSLFVNQAYSVRIEGWSEDESAGILKFLFEHSRSPAMTARFRWTPGAILIWDNRVTTHYAIGDYGGHRREMYRLAVTGERPQ